jgi:hypothetical protein
VKAGFDIEVVKSLGRASRATPDKHFVLRLCDRREALREGHSTVPPSTSIWTGGGRAAPVVEGGRYVRVVGARLARLVMPSSSAAARA